MKQGKTLNQERRKALKLLGLGAATIPLAALAACGGEDAAPKPAAKPVAANVEKKAEEMVDAAEDVVEDVKETVGDAAKAEMPVLSADDPQAKSLGYVADATSVDGSKYPRYADGQACGNCALYMGGDAAQGACSIFPGKAVMAAGWCSVYAPKA